MSEKRTVRTVRRGGVVDGTPVDGNLVRAKNPKTLTLVGLPAVQSPFKVTRSDDDEGTPVADAKKAAPPRIMRKAKRSDSPVLRLTFPEGTEQADVETALATYGMEGYTISNSDGIYTATRSDLKSIAKDSTTPIKLTADGVMAEIARNDTTEAEGGTKLAITSLTFDAEKFTSDEAITDWLEANGVDGELVEGAGTVKRSDVPANEETRQMQIDDGVTATIIRSDVNGVPDGFVLVVSEAAYGGWGWGQLDFSAMMADVVFSEKSRQAVDRLESVLRNIMFYSELPLAVRKTLKDNALAQFGAYIDNLMDALPSQLMISVVRSDKAHQQENVMTQKTTASPEVKTTTPAAQSSANTPSEIEALRSDLATLTKLVSDTVALVKRSAPLTDEEKAAQAAAEAAKPITRADLDLALAAQKKTHDEEIAALKGQTVVRSSDDGQDSKEAPKKDGDKAVKRSDSEIFRNCIPFPTAGRMSADEGDDE